MRTPAGGHRGCRSDHVGNSTSAVHVVREVAVRDRCWTEWVVTLVGGRRVRGVLGAAVALLVGVTGCSDDGDDGTGSNSSSRQAAPVTSAATSAAASPG